MGAKSYGPLVFSRKPPVLLPPSVLLCSLDPRLASVQTYLESANSVSKKACLPAPGLSWCHERSCRTRAAAGLGGLSLLSVPSEGRRTLRRTPPMRPNSARTFALQ